jgi:excisionase family DNA binding protein
LANVAGSSCGKQEICVVKQHTNDLPAARRPAQRRNKDWPENMMRLVSVDEAIPYARICRSSLQKLIKAGNIRSVKLGRRVLVDLNSIDTYYAALMAS